MRGYSDVHAYAIIQMSKLTLFRGATCTGVPSITSIELFVIVHLARVVLRRLALSAHELVRAFKLGKKAVDPQWLGLSILTKLVRHAEVLITPNAASYENYTAWHPFAHAVEDRSLMISWW